MFSSKNGVPFITKSPLKVWMHCIHLGHVTFIVELVSKKKYMSFISNPSRRFGCIAFTWEMPNSEFVFNYVYLLKTACHLKPNLIWRFICIVFTFKYALYLKNAYFLLPNLTNKIVCIVFTKEEMSNQIFFRWVSLFYYYFVLTWSNLNKIIKLLLLFYIFKVI
jgi:hypothetical protein